MARIEVGIFLLGFGAPDSLEAIKPFLRSVFSSQGKVLSPHIFDKCLKEATKRYKAIGGGSPYLDITRLQAKALEKKLNEKSNNFKVYIGMRNWHPFIEQTTRDVAGDGARRIIVLSLSPQYNRATTGSNIRELKHILNQTNISRDVTFIDSWCDNPTYLDALSDKVRQGLSQISKIKQDQAPVLFSAHGLPKRLIEQGGVYLNEERVEKKSTELRVGNGVVRVGKRKYLKIVK